MAKVTLSFDPTLDQAIGEVKARLAIFIARLTELVIARLAVVLPVKFRNTSPRRTGRLRASFRFRAHPPAIVGVGYWPVVHGGAVIRRHEEILQEEFVAAVRWAIPIAAAAAGLNVGTRLHFS